MNQQVSHPLPLGTQVTVSDGTPRPPERFKRKLADWKHNNYTGVVTEHTAGQTYTVQQKPNEGWNPNAWMLIFRSNTPALKVRPIAGACLAPLTGNGCSATVDAAALIRLESVAA